MVLQTDMTTEFVVKRRVKFGDCDPGGVLYTPNIGHYVVESVRDYLDHLLGAPMERTVLDMGVAPPAKTMSVEFLSFMTWDDELDIKVRIRHIGNSSFSFDVNGYCDETHVFGASFCQVCVDLQSRRPTDIPVRLLEALKRGLGTET